MTSTRYLCIDDQQDSSVDDLLRSIEKRGSVTITRRTPLDLNHQLPAISDFAKDAGGEPIGLLIDLRLDVDADSDGNRVVYRGPTLAQEIRTRMAEGDLPPFPIVLWSIDAKFRRSYTGDETSHDLFDLVLGKDDQVISDPQSVSTQLASLALGYQKLAGADKANAMARLGLADESPVYARFESDLLDIVSSKGTPEVAHLLLRQLIGAQGLLVTEAMLAARLGVDIKASADAWEQLKGTLAEAMYQGPFFEGWPRWWWYRVEDFWASFSDGIVDLKRLTATERVDRLNHTHGTKLVAAQPIEQSYSTKYSTLCVATERPLDPIDGLRVVQRDSREWHDIMYVSVHGALERVRREQWRLDPLERERLGRIKEERGSKE
ncbi:hypothetical protein [Pseudoxanthomonas mexicana]|uniref:hypothetical protein n=1 Tax=Pseudoxanthomonas mexicana TaxID=128785 RepID=UPI0020A15B2D|nr:hypothetical protein [Pseudoxanthomonas mexicana]MCP1582846.1 hypothetical protein [Pseudoxanthomonas mexicana]